MICTRCKKEMPIQLKSSGEPYRQCKECRKRRKCPHNRYKYECKDCKGTGICVHNNYKSNCKQCKGSNICIHNKAKNSCKECGKKYFCEHGRFKCRCKDCGGNSLCKHKRQKNKCKECNGVSICAHGKYKSQCRECGGASICIHKKQKSQCLICSPKSACEKCKSVFVLNSPYYPLCARCYGYTYPDDRKPYAKHYKLKEKIFVEEIEKKYPNLDMRFDLKIDGGCSGKRPDIFIDCFTHVIIEELDENEHSGYEEICENRRIMELFIDIGNRPVVILRLNPDAYTKDDEKYASCFSYTTTGVISVDKKEFEKRLEKFTERMDYWLDNIPNKEVTIEKFFYSS